IVSVLADLEVGAEAGTILLRRLAGRCDGAAAGDEREAQLKRIGTAVGKYWVCKRGPVHVAEALECLGGNGYVEESVLPRLYREAPLNSIWEGSGNVNALDVLRVLTKGREALETLFAEIVPAVGMDKRLDAAVAQLRRDLVDREEIETRARRLVERLALVWQGALLVQYGSPAVADAFCASRLGGDWGVAFGTLPAGADLSAILERAQPRLS